MNKMKSRLNILMIASECVPFAKTGGLADVVGALPKALRAFGHNAVVVMPKYSLIDANRLLAYRSEDRLKAISVKDVTAIAKDYLIDSHMISSAVLPEEK